MLFSGVNITLKTSLSASQQFILPLNHSKVLKIMKNNGSIILKCVLVPLNWQLVGI